MQRPICEAPSEVQSGKSGHALSSSDTPKEERSFAGTIVALTKNRYLREAKRGRSRARGKR
jgi:hypothetical protein